MDTEYNRVILGSNNLTEQDALRLQAIKYTGEEIADRIMGDQLLKRSSTASSQPPNRNIHSDDF